MRRDPLAAADEMLASGRWAEAEALLAAAGDAGDAEAAMALGRLCLQRGAWAEALLAGLAPAPAVLHLLGRSRLEAGRGPEALEPLRHLSDWLRWLLRHGRSHDVDTVLLRGPRLVQGLWDALRPSWRAVLEAEGEAERALRLGG